MFAHSAHGKRIHTEHTAPNKLETFCMPLSISVTPSNTLHRNPSISIPLCKFRTTATHRVTPRNRYPYHSPIQILSTPLIQIAIPNALSHQISPQSPHSTSRTPPHRPLRTNLLDNCHCQYPFQNVSPVYISTYYSSSPSPPHPTPHTSCCAPAHSSCTSRS